MNAIVRQEVSGEVRTVSDCKHCWDGYKCTVCGADIFALYYDLRAKLGAANLTSSVLRAKLLQSEQERDNLQAQLNGMTEARDTFYNDIVRYKKSCDDLIKLRDELFGKIDKLTADNNDLQAANSVLREALYFKQHT